MAKDDSTKKVQTYYLKKANIDWLNRKAFDQSTPDDRVTDDALLDALLDQVRETGQSPSPKQSKKNGLANSLAA